MCFQAEILSTRIYMGHEIPILEEEIQKDKKQIEK
jgi:hypothetical protein